jgi:hypothetical protein
VPFCAPRYRDSNHILLFPSSGRSEKQYQRNSTREVWTEVSCASMHRALNIMTTFNQDVQRTNKQLCSLVNVRLFTVHVSELSLVHRVHRVHWR